MTEEKKSSNPFGGMLQWLLTPLLFIGGFFLLRDSKIGEKIGSLISGLFGGNNKEKDAPPETETPVEPEKEQPAQEQEQKEPAPQERQQAASFDLSDPMSYIPPEVRKAVHKETTRAEGGYVDAVGDFVNGDGHVTMMGIQDAALAAYSDKFTRDEAITYLRRMGKASNYSQQIPESWMDGEITEADIRATNPNMTDAEIAEFQEFLVLREEILFQDHVIADGLHKVHPEAQLFIFDTAFHRGPAVSYWMMADIVNEYGGGTFPESIPYHAGYGSNAGQFATEYSHLSSAEKEEIIAQFNQLLVEQGRDKVNGWMRDAKIKQHDYDIAQNLAGRNVDGVSIDRGIFLLGWTNRAHNISQQNTFPIDTLYPQALDVAGKGLQNNSVSSAAVQDGATVTPSAGNVGMQETRQQVVG